MPPVLTGLKPSSLWNHFEAILSIPHGSGGEKALGDHILAQAKKSGLAAKRDKTGNIVVRILKGEKPGKIPVTVADKTNLYVNPTIAEEMGLTIPEDVVSQADEVVR